jgi:hypothetical protein
MNEMNEPAAAVLADQMINDVVARRAAAGQAGGPGQPGNEPDRPPLTADEALVTELAALSVVDWPADETGERIARSVAGLAVQPLAGTPDPGSHRRAGRVRSRRTVAVAGAAAAVLLAAAAAFGPWQQHGTAGPGAAHPPAPTPVTGSSAAASPVPYSHTVMRLVGLTTPVFEQIGTVSNTSSFLTCVTDSVCYANGAAAMERTADGGVTWHPGASLTTLGGPISGSPSCPTTLMCAMTMDGSSRIAVTTDGFAHIKTVQPTSAPGDTGPVEAVSCATPRSCAVAVDATSGMAFLTTSDGGLNWSASSVPAIGLPQAQAWQLRCDRRGDCIALMLGGAKGGQMVVMRSADGGRTWSASGAFSLPDAQILMTSCGDGRHCMMVTDTGFLVTVAGAADGPVSVRVRAFPRSWPRNGIAVSCASGRHCVVSLADGTSDNYASPAIEVTSDAGLAWSRLSLPTSVAVVYPMSCPGPAGCIGVAASASQFANGQQRMLVSNLPPSG